jgi:hypothetical protein
LKKPDADHRRQITQEAESITGRMFSSNKEKQAQEATQAAERITGTTASHRTGLIDAYSLLNRLDG